jgi:hypothetical protein
MQCSNEPVFVKEESKKIKNFDYSDNDCILENEINDSIGGNNSEDDDE